MRVNPGTITNAYNFGVVTGQSNGIMLRLCSDSRYLYRCYFLGTGGGIGNNSSSTVTGKSARRLLPAKWHICWELRSVRRWGQILSPCFALRMTAMRCINLSTLTDDEHAVQYYNSGSLVSTASVPVPTSDDGIFSEWGGDSCLCKLLM